MNKAIKALVEYNIENVLSDVPKELRESNRKVLNSLVEMVYEQGRWDRFMQLITDSTNKNNKENV